MSTEQATTEVVYVDKAQAALVRKKKTAVVEKVLSDMVNAHGSITPQMLVEEARNESHALHHYFEWDDALAADKYRLRQATEMILATKFVCMLVERENEDKVKKAIEEASKPHLVRKFLPDFHSTGTYKGRGEVLSEAESRKAIVEKKISTLRAWCSSVVDIDELSEIRENILTLII